MNRKEFLHYCLLLGTSIAGGQIVFQSCNQKNGDQTTGDQSQPPDPCDDLSMLSEEQMEIRKTFEYVNKTPYPEKKCDNCSLWIAPKEGELCGGCQIMDGPVKAEAYCNAWVAIE
jgi:hypothetical protein